MLGRDTDLSGVTRNLQKLVIYCKQSDFNTGVKSEKRISDWLTGDFNYAHYY